MAGHAGLGVEGRVRKHLGNPADFFAYFRQEALSMVKSENSLLPAHLGVLPVFRRLPPAGLLLWLLTFHVGAAMWCLAFVTFAHSLPLSVWPPLAALVLNLASSALLTLSSQQMHRGGDPANLAGGLYRPALVVGALGLVLAIYAAMPFFVLTA